MSRNRAVGMWKGLVAASLLGLATADAAEVLVSSRDSSEIYKFDSDTGVGSLFIGSKGTGLSGPVGMRYGPDGNLYVANFFANNITKYDGKTGAPLGVFVSSGLTNPSDLRFGPDGNLYVANYGTTTVVRYDALTGAPLAADAGKAFASGGDLSQPTSIKFQGNTMYVASFGTDKVLSYDITAKAPAAATEYIDLSVLSESGVAPGAVAFGPDGNVYVSGILLNRIGVFDADNTASFTSFATPAFAFPSDLLFTPDGRLLVASLGMNAVLGFDPVTGQQLYVDPINNPQGLFFTSTNLTIAAQLLFVAVSGDGNEDTIVDGADYTIWADHFLQTSKLGAMGGDYSFDGVVDGADYTIWADNYAPLSAAASLAVPEPSSGLLALFGLVIVMAVARHGRIARARE